MAGRSVTRGGVSTLIHSGWLPPDGFTLIPGGTETKLRLHKAKLP
jgi:hypothetical protein